uniref:Ring finger protein 135 n=1 Tax=Latimeria chalumnae TaxID=7897 RepID=H3BB17_LATCH
SMAAFSAAAEDLNCAICCELFDNAVSLNCGHSFCRQCIEQHWEKRAGGGYTCPLCMKAFREKPELNKNTVLCALAERCRAGQGQAAACGSEVCCSFCPSSPDSKADRTCLTCRASYCAVHLKPHLEVAALKEHLLVAPVELTEKQCQLHGGMLAFHCKSDKGLLCSQCFALHQECEIVSIEEELREKIGRVKVTIEKLSNAIQSVEGAISKRNQERTMVQESATQMKALLKTKFTELMTCIEKQGRAALRAVEHEERATQEKISGIINQLADKAVELKKAKVHIEQLEHEDWQTLLKKYKFFSLLSCFEDLNLIYSPSFLQGNGGILSQLSQPQKSLNTFLAGWSCSNRGSSISTVIISLVPAICWSKAEYCTVKLTFDSSTANRYLRLERNNVTVTSQLHHPSDVNRFAVSQVMCLEGFSSGRHSWKVNTEKSGGWAIGIAYKPIDKAVYLGRNSRSWCLEYSNKRLSAWHSRCEIPLDHPKPCTVIVELDYIEGKLSFYSITETATLLHTFEAVFTQSVFPAFWLYGLEKQNTLILN